VKGPYSRPAVSAPRTPGRPIVFRHACKLGLEGIVSKRLGSRLSFRLLARLAEVQEPGRASGEGGRRSLDDLGLDVRTVTS
jgi:hypothetical protein